MLPFYYLLLTKDTFLVRVLRPDLPQLESRNPPARFRTCKRELIGPAEPVVLVRLRRVHGSGEPQVAATRRLVAVDAQLDVAQRVLLATETVFGAAYESSNLLAAHDLGPIVELNGAVFKIAACVLVPLVRVGKLAVTVEETRDGFLILEPL